MNKATWKEFYRLQRIALRLAEEQQLDMLIYGNAFRFEDDTGIYNIPPDEILFKDSKAEWRPK